MTTLANLGNMLEKARKHKKLTKVALAKLSKVHRNTVQQIETGMGNVELNTLISLCDTLGLSIVLVPDEVVEQIAPEGGYRESAMARMLNQRRSVQAATMQTKAGPKIHE